MAKRGGKAANRRAKQRRAQRPSSPPRPVAPVETTLAEDTYDAEPMQAATAAPVVPASAARETARDAYTVQVRPELVVEITFDHVSDGRIRHGSKVQRWRDDKAPEACTLDQLGQ